MIEDQLYLFVHQYYGFQVKIILTLALVELYYPIHEVGTDLTVGALAADAAAAAVGAGVDAAAARGAGGGRRAVGVREALCKYSRVSQ